MAASISLKITGLAENVAKIINNRSQHLKVEPIPTIIENMGLVEIEENENDHHELREGSKETFNMSFRFQDCDKLFITEQTLKKHTWMNFKCDMCSMTFDHEDQLSEHLSYTVCPISMDLKSEPSNCSTENISDTINEFEVETERDNNKVVNNDQCAAKLGTETQIIETAVREVIEDSNQYKIDDDNIKHGNEDSFEDTSDGRLM